MHSKIVIYRKLQHLFNNCHLSGLNCQFPQLAFADERLFLMLLKPAYTTHTLIALYIAPHESLYSPHFAN